MGITDRQAIEGRMREVTRMVRPVNGVDLIVVIIRSDVGQVIMVNGVACLASWATGPACAGLPWVGPQLDDFFLVWNDDDRIVLDVNEHDLRMLVGRDYDLDQFLGGRLDVAW